MVSPDLRGGISPDHANWKGEPTTLTQVASPDDIARVTEQISDIYQPPHDLSREALQTFIATLSQSPLASAVIFVDREESSFRPGCDVHTFAPEEIDYRADRAALENLYSAHTDFLLANERRGSRRDSHLHVKDLPDGALPQNALDTVRSELQDVPAARVIAAIVFSDSSAMAPTSPEA